MDDTTRANGYKHGRPEGRDVKPADEIVRKVIEALPAEARLYPDVYAWQVTDALEAATVAPAVDREALVEWFKWHADPNDVADALLASGILRDVRDVQAEALERAAVAIRPTNPQDDWTDYAEGIARGADLLELRAQAIREARNA